jgi:hypothetical protein
MTIRPDGNGMRELVEPTAQAGSRRNEGGLHVGPRGR